MAQQDLNGAQVACLLVDDRGFGATKRMGAVVLSPEPDSGHPFVDQSSVLTRAHVGRVIDQKALAIEPDRPDGQDMRAVINQELGNTDDLLSAGEAEIRLNPKGAFGYERRGEAYSRKGEIEKAAADFQRATLLNPGQASAWARLGTLKAIQGDKSGAFEAFDRALAIDPTWIEALVNRGKLYADEGRMDEAAADFRASLDRSSDSGRARQLQKEALTRWVVITKRIPPAEPRTSLDKPR